MNDFKVVSIFDLLMDYLAEGRIEVTPSRDGERPATYHDSCNYGRKSLKTFGHGYFEEGRRIVRRCRPEYVDMTPDREGNYCCGGGGGLWAMPFTEERVYYGRIKARQIRKTGAGMVATSCHNCRDQLLSLRNEYDLDVEVKLLWQLVADSLVMPWMP